MSVPNNDKGIAMIEMSVVLKLPKKSYKMMMTKIAPSMRALATLLTDASMTSA